MASRGCIQCSLDKVNAYRLKDLERWAKRFKDWREKNADRDKAKSREWQINNPDKARAGIAKRSADIARRTPRWANHELIKAVYAQARQLTESTGIPHHVDHEIPLRGKRVSGLHVQNNLRAIPAEMNKRKSNSYSA